MKQSPSQPMDRLIGDQLSPSDGVRTSYGTYQTRRSRVEINDAFLLGASNDSSAIRTDYFGETIRNVHAWSYAFLVLVILELSSLLFMSLYHVYDDYPPTTTTKVDFVYSMVLALNIVFCMHYVIHGVLKERSIELFTFVAASVILTAYVIYEFIIYNGDPDLQNRKWRMIVCCVCEPFNILGALYVARTFGWVNFIIIGADLELGAMFDTLYTYYALFKINVQMALCVLALSFFSQDMAFDYEWVIEAVALAALVINALISNYMFSRERDMMCWYFLVSTIQPMYVTWKVLEVSTVYPEYYDSFIRLPVQLSGVTSLAMYFLTIVWAIKTRNNFGKGLLSRQI
eukprot:CFRG6057T1